MKYLIDTNCFLSPHKTFCPIDVGVSFWNKIIELAQRGLICSLDKVRNEMSEHNDELHNWLKLNLSNDFFHKFDGDLQAEKLRSIIKWASSSERYFDKAKEKFMRMDKADIYLVAYASVSPDDWTVVSLEAPSPNNRNEIKLPDVCSQFKVRCIKPQDMFRQLRETF